jgi:thioredoxin-like negative regulator of GroEL
MTPIVDGLRRDYKGQLDVVYAEIDEPDGKELAKQMGVVGTPTILLLDSHGEQVNALRGSFPASLIEQAIQEVLAQ